jgi:threonine/homoserine/homoserine lactone efflux protein
MAMRLGLLAILIVGGAIFHHHGPAYDVIHVVYIVAVLGFLGWRIMRRRQRTPQYRDPDANPPT